MGNKLKWIGGIVVVLVIIGTFMDDEPKDNPEKVRKGFHCLSEWDGTHWELISTTKRRIRDPDSFEHIETRITPISSNGTHNIFMKFHARNGFGGMTEGFATGKIRNSDCSVFAVEVGG